MKKQLQMTALIFSMLFLAACGESSEEAKENNNTSVADEETGKQSEPIETQEGPFYSQSDFYEPFEGSIDHIHGVGYVGGVDGVSIATHTGIKVYEDGDWFQTTDQNHDYMGFSPVGDGFYTSGHPAEGSNLVNPFGIKKSTDFGQTLETLALEGETDFHAMGVGYENHVIYVFSPHKSSSMDVGVYYSEDDAETWEKSAAKGIDEVGILAAHPTDGSTVTVGNRNGIFLSTDHGNQFESIDGGLQGTSAFFTKDSLYYGGYNGTAVLARYSLDDGETSEFPLPEMEEDTVMNIAVHPRNEQEMVIATYKGNIYMTSDHGESWEPIVLDGTLQ